MSAGQIIRKAATSSRRALRLTSRSRDLPSVLTQQESSRELAAFLSLPPSPPKPKGTRPRRSAFPNPNVAGQSRSNLSKRFQPAVDTVMAAINQTTQPLPPLSAFNMILQTDPPPAGDSLIPPGYLLPWILIFQQLHARSCQTRSSDCFWLSIEIYRLLQFEHIVDVHRQMIIHILKSALAIKESEIDQKVWDAVVKLTENVGKLQEPKHKKPEKNKDRSALRKFQGQIRTALPKGPDQSLSAYSTQIVQILILVLRLLAQTPALPDLSYMHHIRSIFDRLSKQPRVSSLLEESFLTHLPNSLMMNAPSVSDTSEIAWCFNRLSPLRPRPLTSLIVSANIILDKTIKTTPIGPPGPLLSFWSETGSPSLVTSMKAKEAIRVLLNAYVQEMINLVSNLGTCPVDHRERTLEYVRQLNQFAINVDLSIDKTDVRDKDHRQIAVEKPEKKDKMEDSTWAGLMINALSWCGDYTGALEVYDRVFVSGRRSRDDLALSVALDACGYSGAPERATKIWTTQLYARQPLTDSHTQSYLECLLRTGSLKIAVVHLASLVPSSISSRPQWPSHKALPFVQEDKVLEMMSKSLLVARSIVDGKTKSTGSEIDEIALKEFEEKLMGLLNEQGKSRLRSVLRRMSEAWKDSWAGEEEKKEQKAKNRRKKRQKDS
ncbi:hypothetical protein [Phaffia rhodozyma]|uniref:Uncharacterized protein n=1 Tax=Phaffia rhodozyma TaxID=264483 RepID=A0A0F7SSS8_PHARH|nr:hypothetical protein [Phaffia rhodozyma]